AIPNWLEGTLIRNGPGIVKVGKYVYNHLFDGLAVLHRYHISNGKATYSSRPLESDTYKKNMSANRIVVSEFGTVGFPDPCKSLFQRLQTEFKSLSTKMTDNCSVNVGYYGDQLYAMTETNAIRRIDPTTLKTIGDKTIISKYVAINHATAHPHICDDGTVYNIGTSYQHRKGPHYVVVKIPPTFGNNETSYDGAQIVAEIPFTSKRYPSYYHSFAITKSKIVFIESPLKLDLLKLTTSALFKKALSHSMTWDHSAKTRFHVASLTDGKIHPISYESDAFFTFHHINAYEEDDQIVVDVAAYDRGDVVMSLESSKVKKTSTTANEATARRFVLPLKVSNETVGKNLVTLKNCKATAALQEKSESKPKVFLVPQHLSKEWIELPRINYHYNADKYNYFYSVSTMKDKSWTTPEPDSLTKVDIENNKTICWSSEDQVPSEPVFIAKPGAIEEDDGVLLSALMEKHEENRVTLLVLDAKDMSELAKVKFQTEGTFTETLETTTSHPRNYFQYLIMLHSNKTQNLFRTCEKATLNPISGNMTGSIPEWLEGTLIRNGPGIYHVGNEVYNHLFDGLAVLHRYHIRNGKATYSSRALDSDTFRKNMAAQRIIVTEFGTIGFPDPCKALFHRLQSEFREPLTDNCCVNVEYYGDQLYAMTESDNLRRIDPTTLKTIGGKTVISKYVSINHATAHPHTLRDGTAYNIGSSFTHKKRPHYVVVKIPPTYGKNETSYSGAKIVAEIPFTYAKYPSYYHSFAITKNKIIFVEAPLRLDLLQIIARNTWAKAMTWDQNAKTIFHVASLTDGKIHPISYESDAFFAFHHINAYEEDDQIVVDVAAYDNGTVVMSLDAFKLMEAKPIEASARRFVLPLKIDTTIAGKNLVTLKDCWAKATLQEKSQSRTKLIKVDIKNNEILRWSEEGLIPSEPVFIAMSGATEEDDGVLLSALMDKDVENHTTLLILDAKNMTELARVEFQTEGVFT
ncbi:Beta,beta-carotene 15,15'-dioxygenase, partial [Pseudolycoriella hygida]